jgi:hypothetical protein
MTPPGAARPYLSAHSGRGCRGPRRRAVGEGVDESLIGKRVMTDGWLRDPQDPANMDKTGYFGSEWTAALPNMPAPLLMP